MSFTNSKAICILGMHRSGTSAVTRAINLAGAHLGKKNVLVPARSDNPEGFWEHSGIVEIHEKILRLFHYSWDTTKPLPDCWWKSDEIIPLKNELTELIKQNFASTPLWAWKDPRTCLLLPLWSVILKELNIDLYYVIVVRNPLDVAASLANRNGFSTQKSLAIWNLYTLSALNLSENDRRAFIQYDEFLDNWENSLNEIIEKFNLDKLDEAAKDEIVTFLKPSLRHSKSKTDDLSVENHVPLPVIKTYNTFLYEREASHQTEISRNSSDIYRAYSELTSYANLLGSTGSDESPSLRIMELFWSVENVFSETNSSFVGIKCDGEFHEYKFNIPVSKIDRLRLDPTNFISYIKIKSIELWSDDDGEVPAVSINSLNTFSHLELSRGIRKTDDTDCLCFFATDRDPQLILNFGEYLTGPGQLQLRIVMSARETNVGELTKIFDKEFENYRHVMSSSVNKLNEDLASCRGLIEHQKNEITKLKNEIDTLKLELFQSGQRLVRQSSTITSLQEELLINEQKILEIYSSKLWRFMMPLRLLMRFIQRSDTSKE